MNMERRFAESKLTKGEKKRILLRLIRYVMQYKHLLFVAVFFSILTNVCALIGPYLSGKAIGLLESVRDGGTLDMEKVLFYSAVMLVLYLLSALFAYLLTLAMVNLTRCVVKQMRSDVFRKLSILPVGYFDMHQTGDILSRMSYDIDVINTSLSTDIVQILSSVITIVVSFVMMIVISPKLMLVFAFTVPLMCVLITVITKKTRPLFRKRSAKLGELNGFVEEMISGQKTLKAYGQEDRSNERFAVENGEASKAYYNAEFFGTTVGPTTNFVNNLAMALVSVFGAVLYIGGGIGLDGIASFVLYSKKFSGPINEIANIIGDLQSALSAGERIFRLLDEDPEIDDVPDALPLTDVEGDVAFDHVDFAYVADKPVIEDLSLNIEKGSRVAIVGPTGAGKTTIINLLMRFYDPQSGRILLDGKDLRSLKRADLRKSYTMVLQDTWLFQGTIYENIAYGKEGATLEDVKRVCRAAGIDSYVESLPDGYDTLINDDATNISKGQKQLLTIARAMLVDSHLLIFDEATSNVDTCTEEQIQKAMNGIMEGKTNFIIAHRLSTVRHADVILVVFDGRIVETGSHEELMELGGIYAGMYNAQFI